MTKKDMKEIWKRVEELRKSGKLPEVTEEDILNEPSALANSGYRERAERDSFKNSKSIERIEISLDPDIEWIIKTTDGKSFLSVKKQN
jgi:hypothetical protein